LRKGINKDRNSPPPLNVWWTVSDSDHFKIQQRQMPTRHLTREPQFDQRGWFVFEGQNKKTAQKGLIWYPKR
jgi:hypothetical protein